MQPFCVLFPFEEIESQRPGPLAGGCPDWDACLSWPVCPPCRVPRPALGSRARVHWQHVAHFGLGFPGQTRRPRRLLCPPLALNLWACRADGKVIREQGRRSGRWEMPAAPAPAPTRGPAATAWAELCSGSCRPPALWTLASPPPLFAVCKGGRRLRFLKYSSCFLFIKVTHTPLQIVFQETHRV